MRRIFSDYTYGPGPRDGCWWDETCDIAPADAVRGQLRCDVVVVGAGITGVSAALHLARAGVSVMVLEATRIGWGASGRNGGFCCLGGGIASDATLDRRFGKDGRLAWRRCERDAVALVADLIETLGLNVDRHSEGETLLAHRARDGAGFDAAARNIEENYGVTPRIDNPADIGMGGPFHRALTVPIGFALNPRKYLAGLVRAARAAGVQFFEYSAVTQIGPDGVRTAKGSVTADRVILATNGYSSEDVPDWMRGRYLPAQSNVLVTRPLSRAEQEAQGWTSSQMSYDTRHLLHYFRLLPDGRFLFGMRGGLLSNPGAEVRARAAILRDFRRMFPAWETVEVTHGWSGLVCLSRAQLPFVGALPDAPNVLAGFAFHGNGVAMGTYTGACLAALVQGQSPDDLPAAIRSLPARFPLGRLRRLVMPPIYAALAIADRLP
ncbi:FAD-binding oxidoreductase [uncultured Tateyamaria sp.]|uniref:NAD(P)/FAD-dependent oxidoreductase n=1 Tax=Tateyamaria sp. 1078 TaxID=3417464 RepID=UPI002605EF26|nr:FAD-binding oxidoreductase [uncultured Tateyamaria sp.]